MVDFIFPPDVFWMSPDGKVIEVLGHATDLKLHPEKFGFPYPIVGRKEIGEAFDTLLRGGWIRGRIMEPCVYVQVFDYDNRMVQNLLHFIDLYHIPTHWSLDMDVLNSPQESKIIKILDLIH